MPTSSGTSSSYRRTDRLLTRRPIAETYNSGLSRYTPPTSNLRGPTSTVKARTTHMLNPTANTRDPIGSLTYDYGTKLDLNNNQYNLSKPYKPAYHKEDYNSSYSPSVTTSSAAYGSHYKSTTLPVTTNYASSSSHTLLNSSRSSSVDSAHTQTRSQRSSLASQNYNDSCSSLDPDTAVRSSLSQDSGNVGLTNLGNVGLTNLGNTCFMNSVLQCLINTRSLKDYVTSSQMSRDINRTTSSMKGALMEEYANLVRRIWEDRPSTSIAPRDLKSKVTRFAPRFGGYNQQDAQEFLRYFLQGLHEDVNRVKTKPKYIGADEEAEARMRDNAKAEEYWRRYINFDDSAIVDLFVGQLKSELVCQTCSYKSVTFDPFWDLSLPIPKNYRGLHIQDCMESFMKEEMLDGDESPTCAKCKEHRKCAKRFKIQKFPKILVLHLKRFSGERYRQKLATKVDFQLERLNLNKFGVDTERAAEYNLYGISNHVGSVYSGHYTAYCKHPYNHRWYSFNDSRVSSVSPTGLVSEEAYVLFYELAT